MSEYKSEVAHINHPVELVYSKLSQPESLSHMAEMLPPEARAKVEGLAFTEDSISFNANGVGNIQLMITEKVEPSKVVYSAVSTPVPFKLVINLEGKEDGTTDAYAIFDVNIPVFLKPMVQGPLNQATEKFKELLTFIPYDKI